MNKEKKDRVAAGTRKAADYKHLEKGKPIIGQPVAICDGHGLWFIRTANGSASWSLRYTAPGTKRARSYSIGPARLVTLTEAREQAQALRIQVHKGIDPLSARAAAENAAREAQAVIERTFERVATDYIAEHRNRFTNAKSGAQWGSSLAAYAYPIIGKMSVATITPNDIKAVLKPIWEAKPETASRVRQRLEVILNFAKAHGWRSGDNPAAKAGNIDHMLPKQSKAANVKHHAAMDYDKVPALMHQLAEANGMAALALQFLILTAARTGEVTGATWSEIDFDKAVWTIPAARMKARKGHEVPLSGAAIAVLNKVLPFKHGPAKAVFPSPSFKGGLSNMTMASVLKRMKLDAYTVHGFRSSFRTWASDKTTFPREVCEAALAHTVGNAVENAYNRGNYFEKRVELMKTWSVQLGTE